MKQHTTPTVIVCERATTLERVTLGSGTYDEDWIQRFCFESPNLLPVEELEPTFAGMIPICKELATKSGSVELVYLNEYGFITIGECKLWRNPEARRKVVGYLPAHVTILHLFVITLHSVRHVGKRALDGLIAVILYNYYSYRTLELASDICLTNITRWHAICCSYVVTDFLNI